MDKELIKKQNERIKRAILVSQMQEHEGFKVFEEDFKEVLEELQRPDIRAVANIDVLNNMKGQLMALENMKYYFEQQKMLAMKPMVDEDTGEKEILNNKK